MKRALGISPSWEAAMFLKDYRQLSPYSRPWMGVHMKRRLMRERPLFWRKTLAAMRAG